MGDFLTKFCKKCQLDLLIDNFSRDSSTKDGFNFYCKSCKSSFAKNWKLQNAEGAREAYKQWAKANPKKRSASHKKWRASHLDQARAINAKYNRKRRSWKSGSDHSPYTSDDVLRVYGSDCYLCGIAIDLNAPRNVGAEGWERGLHLEHVIALANGGADTIENVKPSHGICNLQKGTRECIFNENIGDK